MGSRISPQLYITLKVKIIHEGLLKFKNFTTMLKWLLGRVYILISDTICCFAFIHAFQRQYKKLTV